MNDNGDPGLATGLGSIYCSQADLILAQYENINRLLGQTTHGTPQGALCEELLKQCLRTVLPPHLTVDKGYVYGRAILEGKETHSPEIDILIHDTQYFSPVFRMTDLVVVQAEAVRAMIQVKRTMTSTKLEEGVRNIVQANRHITDMVVASKRTVFTAVIAYDGRTKPATFQKCLSKCYEEQKQHDRPTNQVDMLMLPTYLGSLKGTFATTYRKGRMPKNQEYTVYRSSVEFADPKTRNVKRTQNVALPLLLHVLMAAMKTYGVTPPSFNFPESVLKKVGEFSVLSAAKNTTGKLKTQERA